MLLISSPNLEMIQKGIAKFYYSDSITLIQIKEKEWQIYNAEKLITCCKVIKKGKRYRFESIET